jgi:Flp pilus assembly protein TadG
MDMGDTSTPSNDQLDARDQSGSVLIPLCLMMLTLMAVVFTAIDIGHYYLARAKLQGATDAVLINAMRLISKDVVEAQRPDNEANIRLVSQQIGIDNLLPTVSELSIEPWVRGTYPINIKSIDYDPDLIIKVEGSLKINTWLVHLLPGFHSVFTTSSSADGNMTFSSQGERPLLVVALLIDRSRSMLDPINGKRCTDCTVALNSDGLTDSWYASLLRGLDSSLISQAQAINRDDVPPAEPVDTGTGSGVPGNPTTPTTPTTPTPTPTPCADREPAGTLCRTPSKFEHAKRAAIDIVDAIGEQREALILKTFDNNVGHLDRPQLGDIEEIKDKIRNLTADGGTNMNGALMAAYNEFEALVKARPALKQARFLVIVITDGNPMSGTGAPCPADNSSTYVYDVAPWMIKAIHTGDRLRVRQQATVYTLGIGSEANEGTDPYQDRYNATKLKAYFLRRLANDRSGLQGENPDPSFAPSGCPDSFRLFSFEELEMRDLPSGRYFKIDGSNINSVVQSIGEDNLMKIVD